MSEKSNPEINILFDEDSIDLLIQIADATSNFERAQRYMKEAGLELTEKQWKKVSELYGYAKKEEEIIKTASEMVAKTASVNRRREPVQDAWEINDIGKNLAKGPALTILDGGPGAGKSFSLGKCMDVMQVPVICLGATNSAAAGLYDDMSKTAKKHAEKAGKEGVPPAVDVLGGLTVDELLSDKKLSKEKQKKKDDLLEALSKKPKPCIMVDEAGLLGHDQIDGILKFAQKHGAKMILAGDSQQIPPEKGQPFKMLVESLKDTPAYVNAPYVFRQSDFIEKAITSGIYHGNDSASLDSTKKMAKEFMIAAYDVGEPKIKRKVNGEEIKFTLKDRLKERYPGIPRNKAVALYVSDMVKKAKALSPEEIKDTIEKGLSIGADGKVDRDAYDTYVCAALACQAMGVRAYEQKDMVKDAGKDIYTDVAEDFAKNYKESLNNGLESRQKKAAEDGKEPPSERDFADGMLAITATETEAEDLNNAIRRKIHNVKPNEPLPELQVGEPIILKNGSRVLATEEHVKNPPKGFKYAYALDVETTQGMSQVGKVTFVVREDTMNQMRGGEILVGATRHKGKFEIKMDEGASKKKEAFYEASTHQFASARIIRDAFQPDLYKAAKTFKGRARKDTIEKNVENKAQKATEKHRSVMANLYGCMRKLGIHSKLMKINPNKTQPKQVQDEKMNIAIGLAKQSSQLDK